MDFTEERSYLWGYFQLHAQQRLTTFNYFIVVAGLLSTGTLATYKSGDENLGIRVACGLFLTIISFIFWQLDLRTRTLIKHCEDMLKELEKKSPEGSVRIFKSEEQKTNYLRTRAYSVYLTYRHCLGSVFLVFGLFGTGVALASIMSLINNSAP